MQDQIAELELRLARVEERLGALEGVGPLQEASDQPYSEPKLGGDGLVENASTHIGHALLIFGGAYLLRAITDFQFVHTGLGIFMGASYAVFWLYMAYRRAGVPTQRASAAVFGGLSIVLTMPLLVEATNRFQLLSGEQSAVALLVYCSLALTVAAARNLRTLAWLVTAGGIATGMAVMIVSHSAVIVAIFLILLGLESLWVVYRRDWMGLQWLGAIGANAGVLSLVALSSSDQWFIEPRVVAIFGTALLLAYLVSFVIRSHVQGYQTGLFAMLQAPVAAGIAFWATTVAVQAGDFGLMPIGALSTALGVCSYALAFSPESRRVRGRNYFFYSTLGLFFVLAGSGLLLPPAAVAALWSLLAVTMAWLSGRKRMVTLSLQCTFLLLAAGAWSGILSTGLQALAGDAGIAWPPLSAAHVGIALATVACLFLPVAQKSERWGALAGAPQLIVLALSVWEVGGLIVLFTAPLIAGAGGSEPNLAVLAALRTAVLSVSSVTLALSSRHPRWPEARWLAYPLLVLVAIKLFAEDFPHGQPATLFVSLVFVGSALLLVAKLIRRRDTTTAET